MIARDSRPFTGFHFSSRVSFSEETLETQFREGKRYCHFNESLSFGCHAECLAFSTLSQTPIASLFPVTEYSYEPPISEEHRRWKHILHVVSCSLYKEYGKTLPVEVCQMIAADLVPEYTVMTLPVIRGDATCTVDVSKDVWVTYVEIQGINYVNTMSNRPSPGAQLVWNATPIPLDGFFYVLEDHLGIRRVTSGVGTPLCGERDKSTRWRTIPFWSKQDVQFRSDASLGTLLVGVNVLFISMLRLNEDLQFYDEIDAYHKNPMWSYLPINPGESVTEIWLRRGGSPNEVALADEL
ncbi:hypothetical protein QQZ08_009579 [Neonectria magnoliae]|uniref:Uncharacterized protein n=1 Tax=Neonectria magnoliae TaxID=2732573 RepID=A0ABR1HM40_9HYPO